MQKIDLVRLDVVGCSGLMRVLQFFCLLFSSVAFAAEDRILADFEKSLDGWTVIDGDSAPFANGPSQEPLKNHRELFGYQGKGFLTTCRPSNKTVVDLQSPEFEIDRDYLSFLLGGGREWRKLRLQLIVDGKVVRKRTPRYWSMALLRDAWDVKEFRGKRAHLKLSDQLAGRWGYLVLDDVRLTDTDARQKPGKRTLKLEKKNLYLPIDRKAPMHRVYIKIGGKTVRKFDASLSGSADATTFTSYTDLSNYQGQDVTIETGPTQDGEAKLDLISQGDLLPDEEELYTEKLRPGYHFTAPIGWLNDPNGMLYHNNKWHLFYQHNPYATVWANMHWGHATSTDLFSWNDHGVALYPHTQLKGQAYSGSAFIDPRNSAGYGGGKEPVFMIALTDTGGKRGERLAYSKDGGMTFTFPNPEYDLTHPVTGRDPKILLHEPTQKWVMAVYEVVENKPLKEGITFHTSTDLKTWERQSTLFPFHECPDLFELPVARATENKTRWIVHGADAQYYVGFFDGSTFKPDHDVKKPVWFGNCGAGQSFSDAPEGRRIQIQWGRRYFADERFSQMMSVPVELSLHQTKKDGVVMHAYPVKELEERWENTQTFPEQEVSEKTKIASAKSEFLDAEVSLSAPASGQVSFSLCGATITWQAKDGAILINGTHHTTLNGPVKPYLLPKDGKITLRALYDRGSVEVFGNGGRVAIFHSELRKEKSLDLVMNPHGQKVTVTAVRLSEVKPSMLR